MKKIIKTLLTMITGLLAGTVLGAIGVGKSIGKELENTSTMSEKHLALFLLMNQWVKAKQKGKNVADYLKEKGYKRIAIYGMSYAGETLLSELENTNVEVAYGIDRSMSGIGVDLKVVSPDDTLDEVDAIVVTAITFFEEIKEGLEIKVKCPIISLEDILYEM